MYKRERFNIITSAIIALAAMSPLTFCFPAFGQEYLNTKRAKIIYDSPADLQEMDRRLNVRGSEAFLQQNSLLLCQTQNTHVPRLGAKIDALLSKVSDLLRLNQKNSPRLSIRLLKNGHQVAQMFSLFQPSSGRPLFGYGSLEAFYEPHSRTILISLKDLHEGILAHEMVHFLLCTGSSAPPPEYVQEDLAKYVESRIY